MGGYQLSLQSGFHNPAARLNAKSAENGSVGRDDETGILGKKPKRRESSKDVFGVGLFPSNHVSSQQSLEGLMQQQGFSPPRHSTACCDGLSLQRELSTERRLTTKGRMSLQDPSSDSFRSDDSDHLALWEEKELPSGSSDRDGWMKLTTTPSPRWLDAMAKLAPWRSSPVHPRSWDTPRVSLDRKSSSRSLHESTKAWYSKKKWGPKAVRQSGELNLAMMTNSAKWDNDTSEDGSSFSRMVDEDTRFTASAVAWDISHRPEPAVLENPRQIPAEVEDGNGQPAKMMGTHDVIGSANAGENIMVKGCEDSPQSQYIFDDHSEYASCRTFVEDDILSESDSQELKSECSLNVVNFVAPFFTKIEDSSSRSGEKQLTFKSEAAPKLGEDEVAPTTETPHPPPFASSTPYETLRQEYIMKSKTAPLDGLYALLPQGDSAKLPLSWINEAVEKSALTKSNSSNGEHRRVNSSSDLRSFTKLRKSLLGDSKNEEYMESTSPRSILRGPDDGMSVPSSSNPSLRSDPGTLAFSARPISTSQSMSSCSASFDLNEGDYEMTYNLNSSAACIIVESRRVSLSFRDFGPAQSPDMAELSGAATPNVEPPGQFDANAVRSSPKLWTATFSARFRESDMPETLRARESEVTELSSPPPTRQLAYLMSCEDEQDQQRPIVMQKSRSRNSGEFAARLGVIFSPLRLISSHESSNHGCFVTTTVSPPHDEGEEARPSAFGSTVRIFRSAELRSSSTKSRKAKGSWNNAEMGMGKSRSSKRRHSSDDPQTVMVALSKAMRKILSKCTVKRSTSKRKHKMDAPPLAALSPPEFHFS